MLKGLVRCDSCDGPIAMASAVSGKSKVRTMQCCNYSKGRCHTSHSITMPRIETAFMECIKKALETSFESGFATNDLARFMNNGKPLGTKEFADKLVELIQA